MHELSQPRAYPHTHTHIQVPCLLSLVHPIATSDTAITLNAVTVLLALMATSDTAMTTVVQAGILPKALAALQTLIPPTPVNAGLIEVLLDVCCRVGSAPHHRQLLLQHSAVPVLLDQLQGTPSDGVVRALLALGMVVNCEGVLTMIANHRYQGLCVQWCYLDATHSTHTHSTHTHFIHTHSIHTHSLPLMQAWCAVYCQAHAHHRG